jgi:hypothetical protein
MKALPQEAKELLKKVDREDQVNVSGDPARELEAKLLVHSESVHTDRGSHAKQFHANGTLPWTKRASRHNP